jgi:Flp pilus assembly protein TadD
MACTTAWIGAPNRPPLLLILSLLALAAISCSEAEPTKDQLLSRANDVFAREQYNQAAKGYRDVLRLAPDDPVALRQLGLIYHEQGQVLQA